MKRMPISSSPWYSLPVAGMLSPAHLLDELLHAVALSGGKNVVAGLVSLNHEPHTLDVVPRVSPVTDFQRKQRQGPHPTNTLLSTWVGSIHRYRWNI